MPKKKLVFKVSDIKGKIGHGGAAIIRILINDITCGAKMIYLCLIESP